MWVSLNKAFDWESELFKKKVTYDFGIVYWDKLYYWELSDSFIYFRTKKSGEKSFILLLLLLRLCCCIVVVLIVLSFQLLLKRCCCFPVIVVVDVVVNSICCRSCLSVRFYCCPFTVFFVFVVAEVWLTYTVALSTWMSRKYKLARDH